MVSIRNDKPNDQDPVNESLDDATDKYSEDEPYEWNPEDFFDNEDDEEELRTPARRPWIRNTIIIGISLLLIGNLIAFLPQIYSLPALRFLNKDTQLSQNEQIQQYKEAVVSVSTGDRKGTGFNIAANGLIITNQHVMADDRAGVIQFPDGSSYSADVIVSDTELDIAILKLQGNEANLPVLPLETEASYEDGELIQVVGNPLSFFRIATEGTILGLTPTENRGLPMLMLQAPIHSGNSGSPVINEHGNVIAVVFATTNMMQGDQSVPVGLAIPIDYVLEYVDLMDF